MSEPIKNVGAVSWIDLTVPDAEKVRMFYEEVTGWTSSPVDMGGYQDHCMNPPGIDDPAAGICHARGVNAEQPPQWMIYINVADLQKSIDKCVALGGKVLQKRGDEFAVIQDPAGAVAGLYQV